MKDLGLYEPFKVRSAGSLVSFSRLILVYDYLYINSDFFFSSFLCCGLFLNGRLWLFELSAALAAEVIVGDDLGTAVLAYYYALEKSDLCLDGLDLSSLFLSLLYEICKILSAFNKLLSDLSIKIGKRLLLGSRLVHKLNYLGTVLGLLGNILACSGDGFHKLFKHIHDLPPLRTAFIAVIGCFSACDYIIYSVNLKVKQKAPFFI